MEPLQAAGGCRALRKCSLSVTALIRPDTQFKHAARLIHIYSRRRLARAQDGISNESILQIINIFLEELLG